MHPQGVAYMHIDCDLYRGASEVLHLLSDHIVPGTVLLFDDLINYPAYREHEARALWEWLVASGRRLRVIGALGRRYHEGVHAPEDEAMELDPDNTRAVSALCSPPFHFFTSTHTDTRIVVYSPEGKILPPWQTG